MTFEQNLTQHFKTELNIDLTELQIINFKKYYDLLIFFNAKFNLTTIIGETEVIEKHFIDSVLAQQYFAPGSKIIDIGSGAGFPGIPLKIMDDSLNVLMVDSVRKKTEFLNEAIKCLDLKKIIAIHARAEDLAAKEEYREKFDICTARAVARLNVLSEYCLPFCKINGKMIAFKAQQADDELNEAKKAIDILGGRVLKTTNIKLGENSRAVIIIEKIKPTPKQYPRGQNKPRLNPLF